MPAHDTASQAQTRVGETASKAQDERIVETPSLFNMPSIRQAIQSPSRATLTPRVVMQLQRSHGNRYVASLYRQSQQADSGVQRAISISAGSDRQSSLVIRRQYELHNWEVIGTYNDGIQKEIRDAFQRADYVVTDTSFLTRTIKKAMEQTGFGDYQFAAHGTGGPGSGRQGNLDEQVTACKAALIRWAAQHPKGSSTSNTGAPKQTATQKATTDKNKKEKKEATQQDKTITFLIDEKGCTQNQIDAYLQDHYSFPKNLNNAVPIIKGYPA
jgi:hypothetical protein